MHEYSIDVILQRVYVYDLMPYLAGYRSFADVAANFAPSSPRMTHVSPGRDAAYRVARDELIERGLVDG